MAARLTVAALMVSSVEVDAHRANPIRRVVDMLQGMSDKVKAEGVAEQALFDKFMCQCKSGSNDLKMSIQAAETKIPQVTSSLEEGQAEHKQLGQQLGQVKADRAEAKQAIKQATAIRQKEAATFAKDSSDSKTNIAALGKAIAAVEKGAGGSFLQTAAAERLQQITLNVEMSSFDRDAVAAFLTQGQGAAASGEIIGILKQLKETMEHDLADTTSTEQKAIGAFNTLVATREKEILSIGSAVEAKLTREGELGENIVMMKEDLDDTTAALAEDRKMLANLGSSCATREAEWEERKKTRQEELLAIADTIKILNDDDALELFKKTLPSASLLQTLVSAKTMNKEALGALRGSGDTRIELIAITLRGGAKNFDKVLTMIDNMVELLRDEQKSDDSKKTYCEQQLDKSEDEKKVLEQAGSDLEKAIDQANEDIATLTEELAALTKNIQQLDADVAEATRMRQDAHAEFTDTTAANNAAKELLGIAKNRMRKFYQPNLYKAPPKRELSREDRITVNMGGTLAPTAAPGGIAGTGVTVFAQVSSHKVMRSGEATENLGDYKKNEASAGVLGLIDMMVADVDKDIQEMAVDEKNSQADYEQFVADSAAKRASDVQAVTDKEGAKASTEALLDKLSKEHQDTMMATMAKGEEIKDLHMECDWLMSNYQSRKEARAGEVDSLKKAKAVLSGADYSLVQTASNRRVLRR